MGENVDYFKRYRMDIDLPCAATVPQFSADCVLAPWGSIPATAVASTARIPDLPENPLQRQIEQFADILYLSFQDSPDTTLFPCLASLEGCTRFIKTLAVRSDFLAGATWVCLCARPGSDNLILSGTIQGLLNKERIGAVQNLGVAPPFRGNSIGTALLLSALNGFFEAGAHQAYLEVTATNIMAIDLYRRLGFRTTKTFFQAVQSNGNSTARQ